MLYYFGGEVVLWNSHGKPTTIKYISPNQSNKILGFLINCLGEMGDEHEWFTHLCGRLLALYLAIWIEHAWVPQPQREGDKSLMEAFTCLPCIKKGDLIKANAVRYYLRVITLFDITDLSGCRILQVCFSGTRQADSTICWPEQPWPPKSAFEAFRRPVKRAFCVKSIKSSNDRDIPLDAPLGRWLKTECHVLEPGYRNDEFLFIQNEKCPHSLLEVPTRHYWESMELNLTGFWLCSKEHTSMSSLIQQQWSILWESVLFPCACLPSDHWCNQIT